MPEIEPLKEPTEAQRADLREVRRFAVNGPQYEAEANEALAAYGRLNAADLLSELAARSIDVPATFAVLVRMATPKPTVKPAKLEAPAKP